MIDIVHLSDTHFGTEVPQVMQVLEKELEREPHDVVVLTGDITQRARPAQFKAAAEFMERLPGTRKLAIPGNHDIPLYNIYGRFFATYANYIRAFHAREYHTRIGNVYFVGFDATGPWRHTRGRLDARHVNEALKRARDAMEEGDMLVVAAHQPLGTALAVDEENILIDAKRIGHIFSEHKVDVVLSGHVHFPLMETAGYYHPGIRRDFILSGAGTAVSHRIRSGAPNSFNRIRIDAEDAITLARYDYDQKKERFLLHSEQRFRLGPGGWKKD